MALYFGVSHQDADPHFVKVRRFPFRIGRSTKCDLCLIHSVKISRRHVTIRRQDDTCYLVAYGSNPTYLNGVVVPLQIPRVILPGDVLELPDYRLALHENVAVPAALPSVTEVVAQCDRSSVMERKIASSLGLRRWTTEGIHDWLNDHPGRQIVVAHERLEFRLVSGLQESQVRARLESFDRLLDYVDLRELAVQGVDPAAPAVGVN